MRGFKKSKKMHMLKILAVYLIGKAEIPIHYTTWGQVEQALSIFFFIWAGLAALHKASTM